MKVVTKYAYPKNGTRNGRVYSREVLEKAFSDPVFKEHCDNKTIPVKSEYHELIGYATAHLEEGTAVAVEAEIFNPTYVKALKAAEDSIGFTLAGSGNVVHRDGIDIVTDFCVDCAMLYAKTVVDCETKIYVEEFKSGRE